MYLGSVSLSPQCRSNMKKKLLFTRSSGSVPGKKIPEKNELQATVVNVKANSVWSLEWW